MTTIELKAEKRKITGKKVKQLRRQGKTPAHLFGPTIKPESIEIDTVSLKRLLAEAGHTRLVTLHVAGENAHHTVMVREVQTDNFKGELLHVDFYEVKLTEVIRVQVPLNLVGESAAAKAKGNTLVQELNDLTIECLPAGIPSSLDVDVSPIVTADQMVRVRDIQVPEGVTVLNDAGVVVARIAVEQEEKVEEKPVAEAEAEAAAEGEAGAEGKAEDKTGSKKEAPAKAEKKG